MLTIALLATLAGFALLVVALVLGSLPLAIACIVVCVVGLLLLLFDTLRAAKRGNGPDDEPLFTIRSGDDASERPEPLDAEPGTDASGTGASGTDASSTGTSRTGTSRTGTSGQQAGDAAPVAVVRAEPDAAVGPEAAVPTESFAGGPESSGRDTESFPGDSGLGSLVSLGASAPADTEPAPTGGSAPAGTTSAATTGDGVTSDEPTGDEPTGGGASEYIRSVTGSFPAISQPFPSQPSTSQSSTSQPDTSQRPATDAGASAPSGAWPVSAEPVAPARGAGREVPAAAPESGPLPSHDPYVGRRRLRPGEKSFVTGELPAITIVHQESGVYGPGADGDPKSGRDDDGGAGGDSPSQTDRG